MSLGLSRRGLAIASISCSPPDSWRPSLRFPLFEPGKQFENPVDVPGSSARRRDLQIFKHGEAAEYLAAFRNVADAKSGDPVRRPACGVLPKQLGVAQSRRCQAHQAAHGRGFAGTVAPQQGNDFTLVHFERHPVQDVAFIVVGMEIVSRRTLVIQRTPDRRREPSSSPRSCRGCRRPARAPGRAP